MRITFDGELQRHVTRISEQIDFTPNKTKEVSYQKTDHWFLVSAPLVLKKRGALRVSALKARYKEKSREQFSSEFNISRYKIRTRDR